MKLTLSSSPHQRVRRDTGQIMRLVIYAMIPGILTQIVVFGWGLVVQAFIAIATALATESVILKLRKKNIGRAITDYSATLTALLIVVSIPPLLPWWMTVIGTFFAIAVVKQIYGGLGYNMFNPAMVAYVMLLVSFPAAMTMWIPPQSLVANPVGFVDALNVIFSGFTTAGYDITQLQLNIDGVTMATPLDAVKTSLSQNMTYTEALQKPIFDGGFAKSTGAGWSWVSLAYGIGGLWLLKMGVISWRIPLSMILTVMVGALFLHFVNPDYYASPLFHLINGSLIIGAFFIATDPISASTTDRGRLIFGAVIGFWVLIIRTFGGYPDAIAFAVIITNMAVPLIDYYTRPRTYGHGHAAKHRHEGPRQ